MNKGKKIIEETLGMWNTSQIKPPTISCVSLQV